MSFKDHTKMNNDRLNSANCLNYTESILCVCVSWQEPKDKRLLKSHTCLDMRVVSNGRLLSLIGKVFIYSGVSDAKMLLQFIESLLPCSSLAFDMCD